MVQLIRLYCPERDRGTLNNYERTETQVIRTRYCDIHTLLFKIYSYCELNDTFNGIGAFNGSQSFRIVNNNIIPNNFQLAQWVHDIEWDIRDSDNTIVTSGYIHNLYTGTFTVMIPQMTAGQYTLSVTYNHNSDRYSKVFPLVVTN